MAKEFVRSITSKLKKLPLIKQSLTKPNDLICFNEHAYIHLKKEKGDEYHCLSDNIKTVNSDNQDFTFEKTDNNLKVFFNNYINKIVSKSKNIIVTIENKQAIIDFKENPIYLTIRYDNYDANLRKNLFNTITISALIDEFLNYKNCTQCKVEILGTVYNKQINVNNLGDKFLSDNNYMILKTYDFK